MKKLYFAALFALLPVLLYSQHSFTTYYQLNDILHASPAAFKFGLYGFENPAITTYLQDADLMFTMSDVNGKYNDISRWGLFMGSENSGFGIYRQADSNTAVTDFRYSFAFGDRTFGLGAGYGFVGGDKSIYRRSNIAYWGALYRPMPYLSVSFHQTIALDVNEFENVAEIGIRPLAKYPLTFFADASMFNKQQIKDAGWSAGVSWEIVDGVRLNGRYFSTKSMGLGLDVSFGRSGIATRSGFSSGNKYETNSLSLRLGALDRTVFNNLGAGNKFAKLNLMGEIKYRRNIYFDNSLTLMSVLKYIDNAKNNSEIAGIVINTSGLAANMEILWEIREKLKEFKNSGKKVFVFIDRVSLVNYHFASVADKVVIDPLGSVSLNGFAMGRSYYKRMLDNIGVGFEELRYFKYKSAVENFARDGMSEGDREQRQRLIDSWYEILRKDICESRKMEESEFDKLVDGKLTYFPKSAIENKIADETGRWSNLNEVIKKLEYNFGGFINVAEEEKKPIDDYWGKPINKIAVIYALGACSMDDGIKARKLVNDVRNAMEDNAIKAVVLRVDSPGGDAMASDYIADVLRQFKGTKPVIISQGAVAASGGYWLSMDGNKIVASPLTITGSIGVIGAWIYNKGLADSMGITTEILKRGKYSDLGYPFLLPVIPIGLPVRNLNEDEKQQMETSIKELYKEFIDKVASGRNISADSIEKIAQGRIWTGLDGYSIGLVDVLGGLETAINIAKQDAGLGLDADIELVELPQPELFDLGDLFQQFVGIDLKTPKQQYNNFKFRVKNNGVPMAQIPLDYLEYCIEE